MNELSQEALELPSATPRVLTRNDIPTIIQGLDASDVLEFYALVRPAPLHGIANSTLTIQKMVLGVRYRPRGANPPQRVKEPVELTLEYGPQRLGPLLDHEAMPFIQIEESASFIAWENVGKVYYSTKIVSENYLSSYYMASMTGAVLNKMLAQAITYAEKRRRYQPFTVYSSESGKVLKSSSGTDFVQFMWRHLAKLGVEIEPILPPPIYEARLWVSSLKTVVPEGNVAQKAAAFYQNLYQCLESIATSDYTAYMPSPAPTLSSQPTSLPTIKQISSQAPTVEAIDNDEEKPVGALDTKPATPESNPPETNTDNGDASRLPQNTTDTSKATNPPEDEASVEQDNSGENDVESEENDPHRKVEDGGDAKTRLRHGRRRMDEEEDTKEEGEDDIILSDKDSTASEGKSGQEDSHVDEFDDEGNNDVDESTEKATSAPSVLGSNEPSEPEDSGNEFPTPDAEKAQQAAQDAQIAANEAKNAAQTEGDTKAADAAQAAANAAQAAADATSKAAAQAAMEDLLSGDGTSMSEIVTSCFTNPQYGIVSVDEDGIVSTEAYLYKDGSLYYKLNLTSPYFEVAKLSRPLPKAVQLSDFGSGGNFVDWTLFFFLIGMMFLGVLVILQQMGKKYINSLYRCQLWFFNPRKMDYEGDAIVENGVFQFGEDAIPLSMGGRLTNSPIRGYTRVGNGMENGPSMPTLSDSDERTPRALQIKASGSSDDLGQVELTTISNGAWKRRSVGDGSPDYESREYGSRGSISDDEFDLGFPERLIRDPDLVDMPDLKSKTKVAVPVGSSVVGSNLATKKGSGSDLSRADLVHSSSNSSNGSSLF